MNITINGMNATEATLRHTITTRLVGANRIARIAEAKRLLAEKQDRVAALGRLIDVIDAAGFASCASGHDVKEYREQLAVELNDLARLENVAAIFDELFQGEQR